MLDNVQHIIFDLDDESQNILHRISTKTMNTTWILLCVDIGLGYGHIKNYWESFERIFRHINKIQQDGYVEQYLIFPDNWSEIDYLENTMTKNVLSYCIRKRSEPTLFVQELYMVGREWMWLQCTWYQMFDEDF